MTNPVFQKDILSLLRLKRVGVVQVAFVGVLSLLVLGSWPQQGVVSLATRGNDSLLLGIVLGQLVLLVLLVPGVASVGITSEREQGTLEMLYASRLSPGQLVVGKLLCAVGYPGLLLLTGLPFIGLLNYRGEVELSTLMWAYLVLVVAAILMAMLSLMVSALCKQSASSLVISYLTILMLAGGVLVPAAIMLASQGGTSAVVLHYLRSLSPVAAALSLLRPRLAEFGGRAGSMNVNTGEVTLALPPSWQIFFPFAAICILAALVVLVLVLRKSPIAAEKASAVTKSKYHASLAKLFRLLQLSNPAKQRKPIGQRNPLYSKERRTNALGSGRWLIRIFYGSLFISLGMALMAMYGGGTEHGDLLRYVAAVLIAFQIGTIVLVNPSLTSSSISSEIEDGTFEMLRLSPLRAGQIFWGKFLPAFLPALLPIVALLPAYSALCFVNNLYLQPMLQILPVFVINAAMCCSMGLVCSAFARSTTRATVVNYLIICCLVILPLLAWLGAGSYISPSTATMLAVPSPLVIALNLLPEGSPAIASVFSLHLLLIAVLCVIALVAAWIRLTALLKQG